MFSMITGFVERNESPLDTLQRELTEELGLDLTGTEFLGHFTFPEANQLIVAFLAHSVGILNLGTELAEVKVLSDEEAGTYDFGRLELTSVIFKKATSLVATRTT